MIQGARIAGAAVMIAIDPVESRRADSRRAGTTHTIDPAQGDPVEPAIQAVFSGKRLRGAVIGGSQILRDFPRYIGLAEAGVLDLGSMVSRRITLDDINEGIDMTRQAEGVRTVVV